MLIQKTPDKNETNHAGTLDHDSVLSSYRLSQAHRHAPWCVSSFACLSDVPSTRVSNNPLSAVSLCTTHTYTYTRVTEKVVPARTGPRLNAVLIGVGCHVAVVRKVDSEINDVNGSGNVAGQCVSSKRCLSGSSEVRLLHSLAPELTWFWGLKCNLVSRFSVFLLD